MVTNACSSFAQRDDLGMCRRIGIGEVAVPSLPDEFTVRDDNRPDWDFARLQCALGAAQGFSHPEFVGTEIAIVRWSPRVRHASDRIILRNAKRADRLVRSRFPHPIGLGP